MNTSKTKPSPLQERFARFCVSPQGAALTDLESKSLLALYCVADSETGICQLSISQLSKKLNVPKQPVADAVDAMTLKGIIETVQESIIVCDVKQPAIRRLVFGGEGC